MQNQIDEGGCLFLYQVKIPSKRCEWLFFFVSLSWRGNSSHCFDENQLIFHIEDAENSRFYLV